MRTFAWALALTFVACSAPVTPTPLESIRPGGEPLRKEFNAAAGKVRAILLASPT